MARAPSASMSFSIAALLALPFVDQRGEPGLVVLELVAIERQLVALGGDGLAQG